MKFSHFALRALLGMLLAGLVHGTAWAQNLVANGGFETGDFTGWTLVNASGDLVKGAPFAYTGNYGAALGTEGSLGYLIQQLTTTPDTEYEINFWLRSDGQTPNEFDVAFGSDTVMDQTDVPRAAYTEYTFYAYSATGVAGDSTDFSIGARNDPGFFALDDVSVTAVTSLVPEPASILLFALGMGGAGLLARRRLAIPRLRG